MKNELHPPIIMIFEQHQQREGKEYIERNLRLLEEEGYTFLVSEYPPHVTIDARISEVQKMLDDINPSLTELEQISEEISQKGIEFPLEIKRNTEAMIINKMKAEPELAFLKAIQASKLKFIGIDSMVESFFLDAHFTDYTLELREKRGRAMAKAMYDLSKKGGVVGLFGGAHAKGLQENLSKLSKSVAETSLYLYPQAEVDLTYTLPTGKVLNLPSVESLLGSSPLGVRILEKENKMEQGFLARYLSMKDVTQERKTENTMRV